MNPLQWAVENLEPRLLLSTVYWNPISNNNWNTTDANWNSASDGSGVQQAWTSGDDTAFTGASTRTITVSGTITAGDITFSGSGVTLAGTGSISTTAFSNSGAFTIGGANLTIGDTNNNGTITLTAGSLGISSGLTNFGTIDIDGGSNTVGLTGGGIIDGGAISWTSGNVACSTSIGVYTSLTLAGGAHTFTLDGADLAVVHISSHVAWNSGTLALTDGGGIAIDAGSMTIGSGDTVTLNADDGTISGTLTNHGTLHWGGTDLTYLGNISNSGTVIFDASVNLSGLTLAGGTYEMATGNTATNNGGLDLSATTFINKGNLAWNTTDLSQLANVTNDAVSGIINFGVSVTLPASDLVSGTYEVAAGHTADITTNFSISGDVTLGAGDWSTDDSHYLTVTTGHTFTIDTAALTTGGILNNGTLQLMDGGSLTIDGNTPASHLLFDNECTMFWFGGPWTTLTLAGAGLNAGTIGTTDDGPKLDGTGSLLNQGTMNIGVLYDLIPITNDGGTVQLSASLTLDNTTFTNGNGSGATFTWVTGDFILLNGAAFINDDAHSTATFGIGSGDSGFLNADGGTITGTLTNAGTLYYLGSSPDALANFANSGTVQLLANVDLSGVTLSGGDYEIIGSVATNSGGLAVDSGTTLTVASTSILAWNTTDVSALPDIATDGSGAIEIDANVDLSGLTFSGANIAIGSGYTATISSTFTVTGATFTVDSGATLDWSGGNLSIGTGGVFNNHGTLDISTTGSITGTVGEAGFNDYSSLFANVLSSMNDTNIGTATTPTFTLNTLTDHYDYQVAANIFQQFGSPNDTGYRNTNGWWSDTDLTAIPETTNSNGVLVTARDMAFAHHDQPSVTYGTGDPRNWIGYEVTFRDNGIGAGTTYTRMVVAACCGIGGGDTDIVTLGPVQAFDPADIATVTVGTISVARLAGADAASDVPSAITPISKILPSDFSSYILPSQPPPVVYTDQDRTLLIGQYSGIGSGLGLYGEDAFEFTQSSVTAFNPYWYSIRGGDSGSPVTMLINGQLVLATTETGGSNYGPNLASSIADINTAIAANGTALTNAGVSGYSTPKTVSAVDFAGFTNYSALL